MRAALRVWIINKKPGIFWYNAEMNILSIDTAKANLISVTLQTENGSFQKTSEQKFGSQVLLSLIRQILDEAGIDMHQINDLKVATGPGSFTGLRVGVAVANALAYSLNIPVNGKELETDITYA